MIVSCREFEFRHDVRLTWTRCIFSAEEVTLAPLSVGSGASTVLTARNIDTDRCSDEVRAVLCTPHNLAIYLQLLSAEYVPVPDFTSYQALLDRVGSGSGLERVYGDPTVQAAERIAAEMATEEVLSLARARFANLSYSCNELENLESAGLLVSSEGRIEGVVSAPDGVRRTAGSILSSRRGLVG